MSIQLTNNLIAEKNKIESTGAYIVLVTLTSPSITTIRLCLNTEDITANGILYQAFPFELSEIVETSQGSLPSFSLKVSNIDRVIQRLIEDDPTYGSGWNVKISVVSSNRLNDAPEIEFDAVSLDVSCDKMFATINCGVANPMMQQFPRQRYSQSFCQRVFKDGVGCDYDGADTTCAKTLDACKAKFPNGRAGNIGLPFLAFNGISGRAIY